MDSGDCSARKPNPPLTDWLHIRSIGGIIRATEYGVQASALGPLNLLVLCVDSHGERVTPEKRLAARLEPSTLLHGIST
jgi:hypothetical protein